MVQPDTHELTAALERGQHEVVIAKAESRGYFKAWLRTALGTLSAPFRGSAEDAVQETLMALWRNLSMRSDRPFQKGGDIRSWGFKVICRKAKNQVTRRWKAVRLDEQATPLPSKAPPPEVQAQEAELQAKCDAFAGIFEVGLGRLEEPAQSILRHLLDRPLGNPQFVKTAEHLGQTPYMLRSKAPIELLRSSPPIKDMTKELLSELDEAEKQCPDAHVRINLSGKVAAWLGLAKSKDIRHML